MADEIEVESIPLNRIQMFVTSVVSIPKFVLSVILFLSVFDPAHYSTMASTIDTTFVHKTNAFAVDLYKEIIASENKNVVISPLSISACLSFAAMGASGSTAQEMFTVLKYNPAERSAVAENFGNILTNLDGNTSLKMANKMYLMQNYAVRQSFNEIANKSFRSETEIVNFFDNAVTAKKINTWVEQKTNDKIKDLIPADSLDGRTELVLVNAVYFKGTWTHQFNPDHTRPTPFWISRTESVDVPMMHVKSSFNYGIFDDFGLSAVEMTYGDNNVSMLILLPHERDGLSQVEKNLNNIDISDMLTKMSTQEVEVFLPKFKIEYAVDLKETLTKLGMDTMFTARADFSELLEGNVPLKVSKVVHKAFLEVNEAGTEAAAATGLEVVALACFVNWNRLEFKVDRPFLTVLIEKPDNIVIFYGRVIEIVH